MVLSVQMIACKKKSQRLRKKKKHYYILLLQEESVHEVLVQNGMLLFRKLLFHCVFQVRISQNWIFMILIGLGNLCNQFWLLGQTKTFPLMNSPLFAQTLNFKKFGSLVAEQMVLRDLGGSNGSKTLHPFCVLVLPWALPSPDTHSLILPFQSQQKSSTRTSCLRQWAVVLTVCIRITWE